MIRTRYKYEPARFRLHVATFNRRAIQVYERAGFQADGTFTSTVNGREVEFLRMVRER